MQSWRLSTQNKAELFAQHNNYDVDPKHSWILSAWDKIS
jgi:hypothetical protein